MYLDADKAIDLGHLRAVPFKQLLFDRTHLLARIEDRKPVALVMQREDWTLQKNYEALV